MREQRTCSRETSQAVVTVCNCGGWTFIRKIFMLPVRVFYMRQLEAASPLRA